MCATWVIPPILTVAQNFGNILWVVFANGLLQNKKIVARLVGDIFKQSGVSTYILAKRVKIKSF